MLTVARGIPLNATVTAANGSEVTRILDVLVSKLLSEKSGLLTGAKLRGPGSGEEAVWVPLLDQKHAQAAPRLPVLLRVGKKIDQRDAKRLGDQSEVKDRQIALAAFDGPNKRPVQLTAVGEIRLGPLLFDSPTPNTSPKSAQKMSIVQVHWFLTPMMTPGMMCLSSIHKIAFK